MTIDQQFVEYIIKSLVSDPEGVHVERKVDEKGVLLTLTVAQDDLGRVIGKRGTTAQSIRTLLRALGTKNDARYNLKIVDPMRPDTGEDHRDNRGAAVVDTGATDDSGSASTDTTSVTDDSPAPIEPVEENTESAQDDIGSVAVDNQTEPTEVEEAALAQPEDNHSDVVSKTRRELEELDDLDI